MVSWQVRRNGISLGTHGPYFSQLLTSVHLPPSCPHHCSPESLRTRNDVFYLQPERSCIAESPLWYSVIPMDRSMLESMLNRILAVREIYEELGRPGEEDLD